MQLLEKLSKDRLKLRKNVVEHELSNHVDVRLGDGLSILQSNDQVNSITICGMGGPLIAKILEEGKEKLTAHPRLILQSNIQSSAIRNLLDSMHYKIIEEVILEEKGHIYEIIVADYFEQQTQTLTKSEIKFGPILLKRNMNYFLKNGKENDRHYKNQRSIEH